MLKTVLEKCLTWGQENRLNFIDDLCLDLKNKIN